MCVRIGPLDRNGKKRKTRTPRITLINVINKSLVKLCKTRYTIAMTLLLLLSLCHLFPAEVHAAR